MEQRENEIIDGTVMEEVGLVSMHVEMVGKVLEHVGTRWGRCWTMWGHGEKGGIVNKDKVVTVVLEYERTVLEAVIKLGVEFPSCVAL